MYIYLVIIIVRTAYSASISLCFGSYLVLKHLDPRPCLSTLMKDVAIEACAYSVYFALDCQIALG